MTPSVLAGDHHAVSSRIAFQKHIRLLFHGALQGVVANVLALQNVSNVLIFKLRFI